MALTYVPIFKYATDGDSNSILIDNIPQGFTDLQLLISNRAPNWTTGANGVDGLVLIFNEDSSTNSVSFTNHYGNGNAAVSSSRGRFFGAYCGSMPNFNINTQGYDFAATGTVVDILNYSNNRFNKTYNVHSGWVANSDGTFSSAQIGGTIFSQEPIRSIRLVNYNGRGFGGGTSVTLYGIGAKSVITKPLKQVTFTSNGNWTAPANVTSVEALVVGGGGGGGGGGTSTTHGRGGGGGGGAVVYNSQLAVLPGITYSITVGAGGTAGSKPSGSGNGVWQGGDGGNSSIGSICIARGGGGGGSGNNTSAPAATNYGRPGGNGGGGATYYGDGAPGAGTQGYRGGMATEAAGAYGAGGGGGASEHGGMGTGTVGGKGGEGVYVFGNWYGGGGGGASLTALANRGVGGTGGGGNGACNDAGATAGSANSGGGGGGSTDGNPGAAGGSGIVIIRWY